MPKSYKIFNLFSLLIIISMLTAPVLAQPRPRGLPTSDSVVDDLSAISGVDNESVQSVSPPLKPEPATDLTTDNKLLPPTDPQKVKTKYKLEQLQATEAEAVGPGIYIVQLLDPPLVTYKGGIPGLTATNPAVRGEAKLNAKSPESLAYLDYLAEKRAEAIAEVDKVLGRTVKVTYEYKASLNGFAVELTPTEAAEVARLDKVKYIERAIEQELHTDAGPGWMGAPGIWDGLDTAGLPGTKGEGIVVGVIDTGIDPWNPSFADVGDDGYDHPVSDLVTGNNGNYFGVCDPTGPDYDPSFPCNDKLIGAWGYPSLGDDPRDTDGHGSHTASTTAGNVVNGAVITTPTGVYTANISGVAPHAHVIAYAACCTGDALAAARDQIVLDGVDVVNYSIGANAPSSNPWNSAEGVQWLNAREAGIFVATSAGNNGPGDATLFSPGDLPWLTSVGANTHNRAFLNSLVIISNTSPITLDGKSMTGALLTPTLVVYAGNYTAGGTIDPDDARLCADGVFPPGTFNGEIVVCERGTYGRVAKGQTVKDGGAGGYILAQPNEFGGGIGSLSADPHVLPAVHIDYYSYQILKDAWLVNGDVDGIIVGATLDIDDAHADIMTDFSSRGPNQGANLGDMLVPNVTAPGRDIWAAYHQGEGGDGTYTWNAISGTSMSSPHVAGAGALLRALHPDWTPSQIESSLMLTARSPMLNDDGTNPATPFAEGSGHVDLRNAGKTGLLLSVADGEYGAADPAMGGDPKEINIASMGNAQCVGECSWTREFSSTLSFTATWNIAAMSPVSLTLWAEPMTFDIGPYSTQVVTFTANVTTATQGEWIFGHFMITTTAVHTNASNVPNVRLPVGVIASSGNLPELVEITTRRNAGSELVEGFETIPVSDLATTFHGLTQAEQINFSLLQDPTNDIGNGEMYDDLSQIFWMTMTVGADTRALIAEILDTTSPDLDMAMGYDTDGDGLPELDEEVCLSAGGSWTELCEITDPGSGTWWVTVMNWQESGNPPDPITMALAIVPNADDGNMAIDGPLNEFGNSFDLRLYWDTPAMVEGDRWYGAVTLGSSAGTPDNIGTFPVRIIRMADDVTKSIVDATYTADAITLTYAITVDSNIFSEDLTYWLTDTLPAGTTYVPGSATNGAVVMSNTLTWSGTQVLPGLAYAVSDSSTDPACSMPSANSGNYLDLEAFDIFATPGIDGTGPWVDNTYGSGPYAFFDDPIGIELYFTDEGYISLDINSVFGGPYDNTVIPSGGLPDAMMAVLWRQMEIIYQNGTGESNRGVTTGVQLTSGGNPVAKMLEFDDIQLPGDPSSQIDFEVLIYEAIDDAPGNYEIYFAYDNLTGDFTNLLTGTIGVENSDGTAGTLYAYNDANLQNLQDGMAICFDWTQIDVNPQIITYQVTVDNPNQCGQTFNNTVYHAVDNPGSLEAMTTAEYTLPCAGIDLIKTVGLTPGVCATTDVMTVTLDSSFETDVTYCYTVENIGPSDLMTHTLVDDQLGTLFEDMPLTLGPGQTYEVLQTVTLTQTTVNSATWWSYGIGAITSPVSSSDMAWVNIVYQPIISTSEQVATTVGYNELITEVLSIENIGSADLNWFIYEAGEAARQPAMVDVSQLSRTSGKPVATTRTSLSYRAMPTNVVNDGSFEDGTPNNFWSEGGDLASPICDTSCGADLALSGSWYAWFGGWGETNTAYVSQTVTIPAGVASLNFWLLMGATPGVDDGWLDIRLDGQSLAFFTEDDAPDYDEYKLVSIDVSDFADDGDHSLEFFGQENGTTTTNFFIDDVSLDVGPTCNVSDIPWLTVAGPSGSVMLPGGNTAPGEVSEVFLGFDSTGLAEGSYLGNLCVVSNDPATPVITVPVSMDVVITSSLVLTKTVDLDRECGTTDVLTITLGTEVTYCYTVENTGEITLTSHTLVDDQLGTLFTDLAYDLAPGETYVYTATATVTTDTLNIATWTGDNPDFLTQSTSDTASAWVYVLIETTIDYGVVVAAPTNMLSAAPTEVVTYTVWLTNTGDVADTFDITLSGNSWTTTASEATVSLNAGSSDMMMVMVTIDAGATNNQTDTVTVAATSQSEVTTTDSVDLTTTAVAEDTNNVPVAVDDNYTMTQDTALVVNAGNGLLSNDTDGDGDILTATLASGPSNGNLSLSADGSFVYTATTSFVGTDSFTYHASDGTDDSNIATVTITVTTVITNNAPVAVDDTASTPQDTAVSIDILSNDSDPDGDTLSIATVSTPANGTTVISNAMVMYTPANGFVGTDSFTYTLSDSVLTDVGLVTVTVTAVTAETYGVMVVAPVDAMTDTAGSTVTYTVWVTNTGSTTDTFDVTDTGLGSASLPTVVGPLGSGMGMMLDVSIAIPTNATNGEIYTTTVTATSQGDTSQTASVDLITTALVEDTGYSIFLPLILKSQ